MICLDRAYVEYLISVLSIYSKDLFVLIGFVIMPSAVCLVLLQLSLK